MNYLILVNLLFKNNLYLKELFLYFFIGKYLYYFYIRDLFIFDFEFFEKLELLELKFSIRWM